MNPAATSESRPSVPSASAAGMGLPPPAVMGYDAGNDLLTVCAWCPGKERADAWGRARGYRISHGCCEVCAKRVHLFAGIARETQAQPAPQLQAPRRVETTIARLSPAALQACREARARLLGCTVSDLDARDRAVEAARPQAKAEAARIGLSEEDYLEFVGDMELNARTDARDDTLREADARQRRSVHDLPMGQLQDW